MRKICVYTICKNEEKNIKRWYESIKSADVIVVVDTGSTDSTWEKLQECGDNMYIEKFIPQGTFNFSAARNFALECARYFCSSADEWIYISLDLDEFLSPTGIEEIREQWESHYDTMLLRAIVDSNGNDMYVNHKIHSADPAWIWKRAVHEIIELPDKKVSDWIVSSNACTYYVHEQDTTKERNYYDLLKLDYENNPTDIKTLMYLAWEAYNHEEYDIFFLRSKEAIEQITTNKDDELYLNYENLIQAYINCAKYLDLKNDNENALEALNAAISIVEDNHYPPIKRVYVLRGNLYEKMNNRLNAIEDYKKALDITERPFCWVEQDYTNAHLYSLISNCYYYEENYIEALDYAEAALTQEPQNELFITNREWCKKALSEIEYNINLSPTEKEINSNMTTKVCVYTICKNEETNIDTWYESIQDADLIYLLDTGSTDNTLNKLKEYPAIKYDQFIQQGTFDFSIARNMALSRARELCSKNDEWVFLVLDLDEELVPGGIDDIRNNWNPSYDTMMIQGVTPGGGDQFLTHRIHSSSANWKWVRKVHETLKYETKSKSDWIVGPSITTYFHNQDITKERNYYELLNEEDIYNMDALDLVYLGWEAAKRENYDQFFNVNKKAADLILNDKEDNSYLDYELLIQALINCASYYERLQDYELAINYLLDANTIIEEGHFTPIRRVYFYLGTLYDKLRNYTLAIENYSKALAIKERPFCWVEEENLYNDSVIYCHLSNAYYYSNSFVEALAYAECALDIEPENDLYISNREWCRSALQNNTTLPKTEIMQTESFNKSSTNNKICVYAMCKNEKQYVDKWLDSMSEADYIVVLDTGSDDGTYEMLKEDPRVTRCEQKVITPWRFDHARNESMKLIPEDANILICTDLDELLDKGWAKPLRERWVDGYHKRGYYTYAWSHNASGEPARVFTYDKIHSRDWHWEFPVHEMLVLPDMTQDFPSEQSINFGDEIYLHHWPDPNKSRSSYLGLLELRKEEYPDDFYGRIYLAHEYYYRGFYDKSINELKDILLHHKDKCNEIEHASCYLFMGDSYRALGQIGDAIGCYYQAMFIDDTYREPYYALADLFNDINKYEYTIPLLKLCLEKTYRHYVWIERDDAWAGGIYDLLAVAYYWIGNYDDALTAIHKALHYNPYDERLLDNLRFINEKVFENK